MRYQGEQLAAGYMFVSKEQVAPLELGALDSLAYGTPNTSIATEAVWQEKIADAYCYEFVRSEQGLLVGAGRIRTEKSKAYLEGLLVHPDHRHQGIAKALIQRRIRLADECGIPALSVMLSSTNSLERYYQDNDFQVVSNLVLTILQRRLPSVS